MHIVFRTSTKIVLARSTSRSKCVGDDQKPRTDIKKEEKKRKEKLKMLKTVMMTCSMD